MRVFVTTPVAAAEQVLRDGWTDLHCIYGVDGVHLSDRPLDCRLGFEGPVVLCLEVPEDTFEAYEWIEDAAKYQEHVPADAIPPGLFTVVDATGDTIELREVYRPGQRYSALGDQPGSYRYAVIPAAVLHQIGMPQLYDHDFADYSRKDLVQAIRKAEQYGLQNACPSVADFRSAIEFFDRHGWQSLVRLREEGNNGQ